MKQINDVQFPTEYSISQDCILFENANIVIFHLKHINISCSTTVANFCISDSPSIAPPKKYIYKLYRWDDTGGWVFIQELIHENKTIAINNLMILAKYFV